MSLYSPPTLDPAQLAAANNGDFDHLLPYAKTLYRMDETAEAIGREKSFVYALVESGRLEAHRDSATGSARMNTVITRRSILLYLVETANYAPAHLVTRIERIFRTLNPAALDRLIASAQRQKERIS